MTAAVLRRAGFSTRQAADLDAAAELLARTDVDAIVCDVNLTPAERPHSLQRLAALEPGLLRRMVVTTTAGGDAVELVDRLGVFAVIRKPFEIERLDGVVAACVRETRSEEPPVPPPPVSPGALQKFVASASALRRLLAAPAQTQGELLLRSEMRRAIAQLSVALSAAADAAPSGMRAAVLDAASVLAADLASRPMMAASSSPAAH